ncbi:MAG: Ig-like domain-containing protein, partial [Terriglobia bacterium]
FQSSFTTGASLDKTAPQIVGTDPANGASSVPTNASVVVTFSKPIDPSDLTPASFFITDDTTGLPLSATTQTDPISFTATLVPGQPLPTGRLFTVTLTTAIQDLAGNSLGANFEFFFTTGPSFSGEADAILFSVLNTVGAGGSASQESDGILFSVLNTVGAGGSAAQEADGILFSVLNTGGSGGSAAQEADGILFSVLNNSSTTGQLQESDGIIFSVNNTAGSKPAVKSPAPPPVVHPAALVDSDGDGYPDELETALGSDPNDPDSIPVVHPVPDAESVIFSVENSSEMDRAAGKRGRPFLEGVPANGEPAPAASRAIDTAPGEDGTKTVQQGRSQEQNQNQQVKGESHAIKRIASQRTNIFQKLLHPHRDVGVHSFRGDPLR